MKAALTTDSSGRHPYPKGFKTMEILDMKFVEFILKSNKTLPTYMFYLALFHVILSSKAQFFILFVCVALKVFAFVEKNLRMSFAIQMKILILIYKSSRVIILLKKI